MIDNKLLNVNSRPYMGTVWSYLWRTMILGIAFMHVVEINGKEPENIIPNARIDIFGSSEKIGLSVQKRPERGTFNNIYWGEPESRKYSLTGELRFHSREEIRTADFTFIPDKSGKVTLSLTSQSLRPRPDHEPDDAWIYFSAIKSEGTEIKNGTFCSLLTSGKPKDWNLYPNVEIIADANGRRELKVSHQQRASQSLIVSAGVPVTITVTVRPGDISLGKSKLPTVSKRPPITVTSGKWNLSFDPEHGHISSLIYNGESLIGNSWFSFKNQDGNFVNMKLERHVFSADKRSLVLVFSEKDWELTEVIEFDAVNQPGLLSQQVSFVYRKTNNLNKEKAFYGLEFHTILPESYHYWIPGSFCGDTRPFHEMIVDFKAKEPLRDTKKRNGILSELSKSSTLAPAASCNPMLFSTPNGTSLVFLRDMRRDPVYFELQFKQSQPELTARIDAHGWALSDCRQNLAAVYTQVAAGKTMSAALAETVPKWFRNIKNMPPQDRPDWVLDASVYELDPRFSTDHGLARAAELIPKIKALGFNTLHIMPVQDGPYWYLPTDFYKISPLAGTAEDYQNLVDTAHRHGLRVWQDIVPHGSHAKQAMERGNSALWIHYNQQGNSGKSYILDFKSPEYQKFIYDVADFYMKTYGIDGFRVDQPWGSPSNWRKKGFPAHDASPENIDKKWFQRSLDQVGGVMPPLEYERASLSLREGGLDMCRSIRSAVKKNRPQDGAIHSEQLEPQMTQESDMLYDALWAILTRKFTGMNPDTFVPLFSQYLEDKKYCSPPETRYLRIFQNHDTITQFGHLGIGAGRAAFAASLLCDGAPMMFQYVDNGHGNFIKQLHSVRNERVELRRGDADYLAVKTDAPAVWCVLRQYKDQCSIGLVNFSNRSIKTRLLLDTSKLLPKNNTIYVWENVFDHQRMLLGQSDKLSDLELHIEPYETMVLANYPADRVSAEVKAPDYQECPAENLTITESSTDITVKSNQYTAVINRHSGMLSTFSPIGAKGIVRNNELMLARRVAGSDIPAQIQITRNGSCISVSTSRKVENGKLELDWTFSGGEVKLHARLSSGIGGYFAALLFPITTGKTWQVNTMEGVLDDQFWPAEQLGNLISVGRSADSYCDPSSSMLLWDGAKQLLDPSSPVISCFDANGKGVEWCFDNILKQPPADIALLKRVGTSSSPALAVYFHTSGPLAMDASAAFSVTIRPALRHKVPMFSNKPSEVCGLKLSNESTGYIIENQYYKIRLNRLGGAIRELIRQNDQQIVLENQRLFSSGIDHSSNTAYSNSFDPDSSARIWTQGNKLYLRFVGIFRGGKRWDRPSRRLWAVTEYVFDQSGAFTTAWYINGDSEAQSDKAYMIWSAEVPAPLRASVSGNGQISIFDKKNYNAMLYDIDAREIEVKDNMIKLVMYNNSNNFIPRCYAGNSCRISVDDKLKTSGDTQRTLFAPKNNADIDGSFEMWGSAYLFAKNQLIPNIWWKQQPGLGAYSSRAVFDRSTASDGQVSLRLQAGESIDIPWGLESIKPQSAQFEFSIRSEAVQSGATLHFSLHGINSSGEKIDIPLVVAVQSTNGKWERKELPFRVNEAIIAPSLRIKLDQNNEGMINLDDIRIIAQATKKN